MKVRFSQLCTCKQCALPSRRPASWQGTFSGKWSFQRAGALAPGCSAGPQLLRNQHPHVSHSVPRQLPGHSWSPRGATHRDVRALEGPFRSRRALPRNVVDAFSPGMFCYLFSLISLSPLLPPSEVTKMILEFCHFLSWFLARLWLYFPGELLNFTLPSSLVFLIAF